jgi:hypothetical protein
MPKRKEFKDMTDDELTDAVIARRVFPPEVRRTLKRAVTALDKEPKRAAKTAKTLKKTK